MKFLHASRANPTSACGLGHQPLCIDSTLNQRLSIVFHCTNFSSKGTHGCMAIFVLTQRNHNYLLNCALEKLRKIVSIETKRKADLLVIEELSAVIEDSFQVQHL